MTAPELCSCGRALVAYDGELEATCAECRSLPDFCPCGVVTPPTRRLPTTPPDMVPLPADDPRPKTNGVSSQFTIDWEEPVPLTSMITLPDFPVAELPGWCRSMAEAVAEETQVPVDLPACLILAVLSVAAARKLVIRIRGGWTEPSNLYVVVALPPGARKSGVYQALTRPVYIAEKVLLQEMAPELTENSVRRDLAKDKAKKAMEKAKQSGNEPDARAAVTALEAVKAFKEPVLPQLVADDVTPEEAATLLVDQGGRLAILSAEGDFFNLILGLYGGTPKLALFKKGHAGDTVRINRRDRSEHVDRPALTLGVCVQPGLLPVIAQEPRMQSEGALARPLYSIPRDPVGTRKVVTKPVPDEIRTRYEMTMKSLILSLAQIGDDPQEISLSDDADKVLITFQESTERRLKPGTGDMEGIRDWGSKLAGAAVRIANLLHIASHLKDGWGNPIEAATMESAVRIAEYFSAHAFAAFGVMHDDPMTNDANVVLEWIRRIDWTGKTGGKIGKDIANHRGIVTRREVQTQVRRINNADHAAAVMRLLGKAGWVREIYDAQSPRYCLHPHLIPETSAPSATTDPMGVSPGEATNEGADSRVCTRLQPSAMGVGAQTLQTGADGGVCTSETGVDQPERPSEEGGADVADVFRDSGSEDAPADTDSDSDPWVRDAPADPDDTPPDTALQWNDADPGGTIGDAMTPRPRPQPKRQSRAQRHGKRGA